jgi:alpha-glucosidase
MTLPYEKHLIDRAVEINYEYTLLDEGWDNWENKWKDLEEICDYARQKNKGVFVWKHCSKILHPEDNYRQMRIFLDSIKNAGAVGVKIDYMNGESKELIDFEIKALELCAERKMMVDFHGCHQPTGESRTYPNEITREGIRGLELNLMREPIPGRHDVALVFTRCILNSADYTPVGFSNSALTSWPHQLATAFAFTSPLIVIAENPDTLFTNPTTAKVLPLMEALPTVWDETIVLPESSVSETAVLARRSGNDWYLAILNGDKSKELTITTNFLKEGKWDLFVAKDDAEKQKNILTERRTVDAGESLNIHLNSNGGYVAQFLKK